MTTPRDMKRLVTIREELAKAGALFERWLTRLLTAAGKVALLKRRLKRLSAEARRLQEGEPQTKPQAKPQAKAKPKAGSRGKGK